MTPNSTDERFMRLALSLGRRGLGHVWPNPAVGCILVKDGMVIGRGSTAPGGRPHAESIALAQAGEDATGATAYVTLEPCAHFGQTPPCAAALISAGVARVVVALEDPDPRVDGRGLDMLKEAGITVETGLCRDQARRDHRGFLSRVERQRPFLTLKLANSFDGRIATASGESKWITGPAARRLVHGERLRHDAVLVGAGTARADDPQLTVRGMGDLPQPIRVVMSRHLGLNPEGALGQSAKDVPLWLVHGDKAGDTKPADRSAWENLGARLFAAEIAPNGQLSPGAALEALAEAGLTRVFCEGGGALAASLLNAGLVDRLIGFTTGTVIGAEGWPSIGALGVDALADAPRFELVEQKSIGGDVMHIWERPEG